MQFKLNLKTDFKHKLEVYKFNFLIQKEITGNYQKRFLIVSMKEIGSNMLII